MNYLKLKVLKSDVNYLTRKQNYDGNSHYKI